MKQKISPAAFISILVIVLAVVGIMAMRVWQSPSSVPAPGSPGAKVQPLSGGIPPEAFRARDEWRKNHPEGAPGKS